MFTRLLLKVAEFLKTHAGQLIVAALVVVFVVLESGNRNDLDIFLSASRDLFRGVDIYKTHYFEGYHYYYSLLFATIIQPLSFCPAWLSKSIWILLNLLFLWRVWKICLFFLGEQIRTPQLKALFGFIILVVSLRFVRGNLHLCQMTIVILFLTLESCYRAYNRQPVLAGVLLALAINFKLLPLVVIPYFIYRAQWKAAGVAIVVLLFLFVAPAAWLGWTHNNDLLASWWSLINPTRNAHILDVDETSFHSITTLMATLVVADLPDHGALEVRRHIANLSLDHLQILIQSIRLGLIFFTLWFLRTMPFKDFKNREHTWWELSYLLLLIPLIFPHQQHYAFLFAMPAMAYVFVYLIDPTSVRRSKHYVIALSCFILIAIVFNLSLWLGVFVAWYNHFKILTYAALLLIPILAMIKPERRIQKSGVM